MANLKGGYVILDITKYVKKYASYSNAIELTQNNIEEEDLNEIVNILNTKKPLLLKFEGDKRVYINSNAGIDVESDLNVKLNTFLYFNSTYSSVTWTIKQTGPADLSLECGFSILNNEFRIRIPKLKS